MTTIRKVAVCGAGGTMGAGIAMVSARAGFETLCFDKVPQGLARSRVAAGEFFRKSVERGRMSAGECEAVLARMHDTNELRDLADCDLVIEAVFEDLKVKMDLLSLLNGICKAE